MTLDAVAVAIWPPCEAATPSGVAVSRNRNTTPEEREAAVALHRQGVPLAEVAARYCVAESTVKMWTAAAKRG
jgi:transposase-like protein